MHAEIVDPGIASRAWVARGALISGAIALGTCALALPRILAEWALTPDSIEHVAIAYNWITGRGFVDPLVSNYYMPGVSPPVPALAMRPPVISVLLAIPLAMGGGVTQLAVAHVVWASLIGGAAFLVARPVMSLSAAIAFAIALAWSNAWIVTAQRLITETTAAGVLLLALFVVKDGLASTRRAVIMGAITTLAWLTRPNLALIFPLLVLAALFDRGSRRPLRARPLWAYVLSFAAMSGSLALLFTATTGLAPYARYGVALETTMPADAWRYQAEYGGPFAFLQQNAAAVWQAVGSNAVAYLRAVFVAPHYLHVGWIAGPAVVWALLSRGTRSFALRLAALAGPALAVSSCLNYPSYDPFRYPLPSVVCLWFVAAWALGEAAGRLARRVGGPGSPAVRAVAGAIPLLVVLALLGTRSAPVTATTSLRALESYRSAGTRRSFHSLDATARRFCRHLERDSLVASPHPWTFYLWCGNAGYRIPTDLTSPHWLERYLDEYAPGFLVSEGGAVLRVLERSPRLERIATHGENALFRVKDPPPRSRPWRAPPPLSSL